MVLNRDLLETGFHFDLENLCSNMRDRDGTVSFQNYNDVDIKLETESCDMSGVDEKTVTGGDLDFVNKGTSVYDDSVATETNDTQSLSYDSDRDSSASSAETVPLGLKLSQTLSTGTDTIQAKSRRTASLTLQDLEQFYSQPLSEASRALGLSATMLKKICRGFGIRRWPHRQLNGIEKSLAQLRKQLSKEKKLLTTSLYSKHIVSLNMQIAELEKKKDAICRATSSGYNPSALNIRKKKGKRVSKNIYNNSNTSDHKARYLAIFKEGMPSYSSLWKQPAVNTISALEIPTMSLLSPKDQLFESRRQALELYERSSLQNKMLPLRSSSSGSIRSCSRLDMNGDINHGKLCMDLNNQLKTLELSPKDQLLHLEKHVQKLLLKSENSSLKGRAWSTGALNSMKTQSAPLQPYHYPGNEQSVSAPTSPHVSAVDNPSIDLLHSEIFSKHSFNMIQSFEMDLENIGCFAMDWDMNTFI